MANTIKTIAAYDPDFKSTCCYSNHGPATHVVHDTVKKEIRPLCTACKNDFDLANDKLKNPPKAIAK